MSISDINDELNMCKLNNSTPPTEEKKTINDILKSNIKNIENFMDNKVVNMYARPWNKLELKLKHTKIKEYIELKDEIDNKTYFYNNYVKLLKIKKIKVNYDFENYIIKNITMIS